ncbi:MAG: OmpA family protein [Pseudomonadota bacterium]
MTDSSNEKILDDKNAAYDELKRLLLNDEQQSLEEIRHHVFNKKQRTEDIAEVLSDSVASASEDPEPLSNAMSTVIHGSINKLIKTDPQNFADALFPVMGPAIRKSINETLKSFMQSLNQVLEQNTSAQGLKWRFESWRTGIPYAELVLKNTLVYRVDEVFLIQPGSGLLMGYAAHPEAVTEDSDAVSAMLSAIQDFVRDSFAEDKKSGLETVELGDHTLWVVAGPQAILACAIRGIAPLTLRGKLQETLEKIHINFKSEIESFDGDRNSMGQVDEALAACLEEQRANEDNEDQKKSFFSPPLIIILIVIFILICFFTWRSMDYENRLTKLKSALDVQPGIVLYDSNELDDQLQLKLLVDPLADAIDDLPKQFKFDSDEIIFHKTAYQSLESEILLRRSKQILEPPNSVELSSSGNTLNISGVAPLNWISSSKNIMSAIIGYEEINTTKLTPDYSAIESAARTQLNIPISVQVKFDGEVLYLLGQASAEWILWYQEQSPILDQVKQINSEKLKVDSKSLLAWLKSALAIPDSVSHMVEDNKLILNGNANYQWVSDLDVSSLQNPWIDSVDNSAVVINEYNDLESLRKLISNSSIFFSDGTETVIGVETILFNVAEMMKRLTEIAELLHYSITVDVVGYTDGLGTLKKNETLALKRANWVIQELKNKGVSSSLLQAQSSEIILSDELNILNRRTDFIVHVNKEK